MTRRQAEAMRTAMAALVSDQTMARIQATWAAFALIRNESEINSIQMPTPYGYGPSATSIPLMLRRITEAEALPTSGETSTCWRVSCALRHHDRGNR